MPLLDISESGHIAIVLPWKLKLDFTARKWYDSQESGEVSEWFKEPVLKTGDAATHHGFESHPLRQRKNGYFDGIAAFILYLMLKIIKHINNLITSSDALDSCI